MFLNKRVLDEEALNWYIRTQLFINNKLEMDKETIQLILDYEFDYLVSVGIAVRK